MDLGDARRQKSRQLELPLEGKGEAPRAGRSGEASTAARGDERLGDAARLMERVVARDNVVVALKRVQKNKGSPAELRGYLVGWKNYFSLADTPNAFRELDEWIRHRLRAIQLKQWKRGRTVYRELVARGLSPARAAEVARNTRRWWRNSGMTIHIALPVSHFDRLGLPRLAA